MPVHRGDFHRVRRSVTIAVLELEALEPRVQLAYKRELVPAKAAADLSLARLMAEELDKLLRDALDIALGDTGRYYEAYSELTYHREKLAHR